MWEKNKNRSSKEWNGCISGVNLLCCSLIISRSRGSGSYIKITLLGISSGNRCEKGGGSPIWRKEKYGVIFQWKLWSSEICECVTVKVRSTRLFL